MSAEAFLIFYLFPVLFILFAVLYRFLISVLNVVLMFPFLCNISNEYVKIGFFWKTEKRKA